MSAFIWTIFWVGVIVFFYGCVNIPAYPRLYDYTTEEEQEKIKKDEDEKKRKYGTIIGFGFLTMFISLLVIKTVYQPNHTESNKQSEKLEKKSNEEERKIENKKKSTFIFDTPNPYFLFPQKLF